MHHSSMLRVVMLCVCASVATAQFEFVADVDMPIKSLFRKTSLQHRTAALLVQDERTATLRFYKEPLITVQADHELRLKPTHKIVLAKGRQPKYFFYDEGRCFKLVQEAQPHKQKIICTRDGAATVADWKHSLSTYVLSRVWRALDGPTCHYQHNGVTERCGWLQHFEYEAGELDLDPRYVTHVPQMVRQRPVAVLRAGTELYCKEAQPGAMRKRGQPDFAQKLPIFTLSPVRNDFPVYVFRTREPVSLVVMEEGAGDWLLTLQQFDLAAVAGCDGCSVAIGHTLHNAKLEWIGYLPPRSVEPILSIDGVARNAIADLVPAEM